ncbi:MAG TPA: lysoplasmalogenase family protein [Candidatus Onthovivens sp.]|nr:lysoplasmalogenase family protein [Candidatus Onthovivens sp.]
MKYEIILLIIGLTLFLALGIIELVFCYRENAKLRKIFKCFSITILGIVLSIVFPDKPFIYVAAFLYTIGDFFLIFKGKKYLTIGTNFFLLAQVSVITQIIISLNPTLVFTDFIYLIIIYLLFFTLFKIFFYKKMTFKYFLPACGYFAILILGQYISFLYALKTNSNYLFLTSLGYTIFIFSDLFVLRQNFVVTKPREDFLIMLTYYLAVVFVLMGLVFSFTNLFLF